MGGPTSRAKPESAERRLAPHGMVLVEGGSYQVGSSAGERGETARAYACDPTWLNDELERRTVQLPAFWIDRSPVTNAHYLAFVEATGRRRPWVGGTFDAVRGDHPVVGVGARDAAAYASWVGKRLPTAEEWEVAARPSWPAPFPWGGDWPGPVPLAVRPDAPRWDAPATRPVGSEPGGRSAAGLDDLAGQVCEWTATTRTHHGSTFHLVKGASWLHEDPASFRTAAASWISGHFRTPLLGFRCALDGSAVPSSVPRARPAAARRAAQSTLPRPGGPVRAFYAPHAPARVSALLLDATRDFLGQEPGRSRGFLLTAPALGPWPVALYFAETMVWNGKQLLAGARPHDPPLTPPLAPQGRASGRGAGSYALDFPELRVEIRFAPGADHVDLLTTVTNATRSRGVFKVSSCLSLTSHPLFYDCEMVRTYQLTGAGALEALRRIPRVGSCVRWIAASDFSRRGGAPPAGVMAVTSRDGGLTFASVRAEPDPAGPTEEIGNPWLNCVHTDTPVAVPAGRARTTIQRLYLIAGGLDALARRLERDLALPVRVAEQALGGR